MGGYSWANAGSIKGEKGDTCDKGVKGDTGDAFTFEDFTPEQLASLKDPKGDTGDKGQTRSKGDTGAKGDTVETGKAFEFSDFTPEQLASLKGETGAKVDTGNTRSKGDTGEKGDTGATGTTGAKGDTGPKCDTSQSSDEEAGWKLPVDKIQTTTTLPTGISAGYHVAICTSSVMAIKEYNGTFWETESLNPYSVIPLKHSGSIQMYL